MKKHEGNARALFAQHMPWAEGLARSVHRRLPPSFDLDDLKQAALIALWRCCQEYEPGKGVEFRAYAHVWVQNACFMASRRREYTERTHAELPAEITAPAERRPDRQVEREEQVRRLIAALDALPADERRAVEAHCLAELTYVAIAQRSGVTPGRVSADCARGLAKLKEALVDGDRAAAA